MLSDRHTSKRSVLTRDVNKHATGNSGDVIFIIIYENEYNNTESILYTHNLEHQVSVAWIVALNLKMSITVG